MNKYEIEYWFLNFVGDDDMGYDVNTIEIEANSQAEAIATAKRMTRGKKYKVIGSTEKSKYYYDTERNKPMIESNESSYKRKMESKYKMMFWSMMGLVLTMMFIIIQSCL